MKWIENGFILGVKNFGDRHIVCSILTQNRGKQKGLIYYGQNRPHKDNLQSGIYGDFEWTGRLETQLGFFKTTLDNSPLSLRVEHHFECSLITIMTTYMDHFLIEGDVVSGSFYKQTHSVICSLHYSTSKRQSFYIFILWELKFLAELGFGLQLDKCGVTNRKEDLYYISPRTGHIVDRETGEPYKDKLFVVPQCIRKNLSEAIKNIEIETPSKSSLKKCYEITTHFLRKIEHSQPLPYIREMLLDPLIGV
ncbi:MAG: DNA repair protein RecO [Alphaproteobacteria bacterium]|nr:DNA repair protein RecO [Alphaproteobacteria bacterium]MBL0718077.1 DNA repair protein RecO [Alphaproteobacteria bacterium]